MPESGYAPAAGVDIYWESYGAGDTPLIAVHPGFGLISTIAGLVEALSAQRRVIAIELQGHGHTADVDAPFSYEAFGEQIAGLAAHLGLEQIDLFGYSLGAGACLRAAIQHPSLIRRLVSVSAPFRRDGWFPEVRAQFEQLGSGMFQMMRNAPMYQAYVDVAPDPDAFPTLMDKTGALQRTPYDWGAEIPQITARTLLVYADADSIPPSHAAEFYALLGGGLRDAGWNPPTPPHNQLAVLSGRTHYDIGVAPELPAIVERFLSTA
ncbi:MAG TPA: alpha/beta hydrolase [Solirubrobacteraceae bacterium]|jgi:pimeloyl-ACP methyl ester carboxylesterase|nr:alpha/beta hydrolase [Solirubrobacteraceae bacterium]